MPAPAGPLASPPVVLLTLEHAGRTWRHSSRPCDVLDGSTWRHYHGGLAPLDVYAEAPITGPADVQSQAVEVIADADLAALSSEGHALGELRAEVSLWRDGDTWGQRRVMLSGSADVESGGYLGRPLRLSVRADDPSEQPGTWPPPSQSVCSDTLGAIYDPPAEGSAYRQIVGQPGTIRVSGAPVSVPAVPTPQMTIPVVGWYVRESPYGDSSAWFSGVWPPAAGPTPIGDCVLLGAGWLYPGPVGSASRGQILVTCDTGASPPEFWPADLLYIRDLRGQILSIAKLHSVGGAWPTWGTTTPGRTYYAAISPPCSGIARPDYRGGLEGAGEVIRWALSQSTIRVDWRRTVPALATLDRFRIAGFWDQLCSPWSWVVDNVLPLLPCSWIPGPDGLYPVVWRLDATASTADARVTDGLDCVLDGEPQLEGVDDIRSRWTLDYGNGLIQGAWRRRLTLHGGFAPETVRSVPTLHLRRAQQRWGSRRGAQVLALEDALTSDVVYRDETADRWLAWMARLYSEPWTTLRIVSDGLHHRSHVARLEPGMVVALTSSRYSYSSRVAHVRRAGWLGGMCYADLVILPTV